jgi:Spy/CpxP family protein refolding chaperone
MKCWTKIAMFAGGAIAWGGKGGHRGWGKQLATARIEKALDYIDATPEQRRIVAEAKDQVFATLQAKGKANRGLRDQVAGLLTADKLDVDKLNAIADAKAEDAKQTAHEIVAAVAEVHAALTPAQRQKLYARFQEMRAKHMDRHGPQGGFGGQE